MISSPSNILANNLDYFQQLKDRGKSQPLILIYFAVELFCVWLHSHSDYRYVYIGESYMEIQGKT